MQLFRTYGIGESRILKKNSYTEGTVSSVKRCWWIRVKTKPARLYASDDNTCYAHIITFHYYVGEESFEGKRYIPLHYRVPVVGESISVYYDPKNPRAYACYSFGPEPV